MTRSGSTLLPGLLLGSAIGGVVAALILHHGAPAAAVVRAETAVSRLPIAAWSWRDAAPPARLGSGADAEAALAAWFALRAPDGGSADFSTRAAALRALLLRLPTSAFSALLGRLSEGADASASAPASAPTADVLALRDIAFAAWIELDPAAASRWAAGPSERRELLRIALEAWSAADPLAAATWACALPDEHLAGDLAYPVLVALAETDASAAMALVFSRGEKFRDRVLPGVLRLLARRDPAGTVQTYGPLIWDQGTGLFQLTGPLGAWADRDPAAAIAWVLAQPRPPEWDPVVNLGYIEVQPAKRAAFAQALLGAPGRLRRLDALGQYLTQWIGQDASAALAWLDSIPDPHTRITLLNRTIDGGGRHAPVRLLPFALALPSSEGRRSQLSRLLKTWAQSSPSGVLRWIDAHQADPDVRTAAQDAQAAILGVIARDDPAAAIGEWQRLPPDAGVARHQGILSIVAAWGRTDPAAALRWQSAQSTTTLASPELVHRWARQDPEAALRWAETLSEPVRHATLRSLTAAGGNHTPPAAALELYAQIKDPALRVEFVTAHARGWLSSDPAAARAWLEKADALSPEQVAALLVAPASP